MAGVRVMMRVRVLVLGVGSSDVALDSSFTILTTFTAVITTLYGDSHMPLLYGDSLIGRFGCFGAVVFGV